LSRIDAFLELLVKQRGSDLHLVSGNPPYVRLIGEVRAIKYRELNTDETQDLLREIMPSLLLERLDEVGNVDFSYEVPELSRFRVNVFKHVRGLGAVFRAIPSEVQTLDDLRMPAVLKHLCRQQRGLILVTGPTGSGKSTTLAAMVDFINQERQGHIITIEDPIEFVHHDKNSMVSQREVGHHTKTFAAALRSTLREDPNVILVGEMRDLETIHLAVTAAEMGILVLGTLHTNSASATVDRIINVFPPGEEPYIRTMLSTSLVGVVSQQLTRTADRRSRVAALEILINNPAVANIIREGKSEQLDNVIQSGGLQGMQSLDTSLRRLLDAKVINGDEAYLKARHKASFERFREDELPLMDEPSHGAET